MLSRNGRRAPHAARSSGMAESAHRFEAGVEVGTTKIDAKTVFESSDRSCGPVSRRSLTGSWRIPAIRLMTATSRKRTADMSSDSPPLPEATFATCDMHRTKTHQPSFLDTDAAQEETWTAVSRTATSHRATFRRRFGASGRQKRSTK